MTCPCPPVRDLQKLARRQLGEADARPLREHLGGCARCREIAHTFEAEAAPENEAMTGTTTWVKGRPPADTPPPAPPARPLTKSRPTGRRSCCRCWPSCPSAGRSRPARSQRCSA